MSRAQRWSGRVAACVALAGVAAALAVAPAAEAVRLSRDDLSDPGNDAGQPLVAAADGFAVAAWRERVGGDWRVRVAVRPADGGWTPARTLSGPDGDAEAVVLAVGAGGDAAVAWQLAGGGDRTSVQVATRDGGGAWSDARTLSRDGETAFAPRVTVNRSGGAVVTWTGTLDGRSARVAVRERAPGGAWGEAVDVSDAARTVADPRVVLADGGDATVLWRQAGVAGTTVRAAHRPAGGTWGAVETVSAAGGSANVAQLALAPGGGVVAAWRRLVNGEWSLQTAVRSGGGWSRPFDRSREAPGTAVALTGWPNGALLTWPTASGQAYAVRDADGFSGERELSRASDVALLPGPGANVVVLSAGLTATWPAASDETPAFVGLAACFEGESNDCFPTRGGRVTPLAANRAVAVWLQVRDDHDVVQAAVFDDTAEPEVVPDDETLPDDEAAADGGAEQSLRLAGRSPSLRVAQDGLVRVPLSCARAVGCRGVVRVGATLAQRSPRDRRPAVLRAVTQGVQPARLGGRVRGAALVRLAPSLRHRLSAERTVRAVVTVRTAAGRLVSRRVVSLVAPAS